jgi:hypothetical protein
MVGLFGLSPRLGPARLAITVFAAVLVATVACGQSPNPQKVETSAAAPSGVQPNRSQPVSTPSERLLLTYYFYWYDSRTGAHLDPATLRNHFPAASAPSWRSVDWQRQQLADMAYAGIDVALPVYWGFDRPQDQWSAQGLEVLAQAGKQMADRGEKAPRVGLFLDTTIVAMRDLTTAAGKQWFYANFKDFFTRIPREQWALVNGRPIAFLFTSDFTAAMNQSTFDYVYERFEADFHVLPYIVREVSWDYPILRWEQGKRVRDMDNPIRTDNNYLWAAAVHGYVDRGGVAAVGPGYDERGAAGRSGTYTDRESGQFYQRSFQAAIRGGKPLLVIETWNEMHEASGICESVEYGRSYIEFTRALAAEFHARR